MNQSYANDKKLGNRIEEMNQISTNLKEVQPVKKRVIRVENEQKLLLQQLKKRVNKIDFHLHLINQTVNYERHEMSKRINEMAIRKVELKSTFDKLKAKGRSLKRQLREKEQTYESDIIYNHFYTQNYEPRIFDYSVYKWTIADVKKKLATGVFDLESEMFPLKGYSFQAKAKLQLNNNKDLIYISLSFRDTNGTHNPVELTVLPRIIFILRDVSKNKAQQEHRIRSFNYLTNSSLDYNEFYYKTKLSHKSLIVHEDYNINDTTEILILVEPPALAQRLCSTDGALTQCVTNYKHRRLLGKEGHYLYHQSPYFSTHTNGYRVQVRAYVDGIGEFEGDGLTLWIMFLAGEFDSTLSRSFSHTATVTLFNQRDLTNHLVDTFDRDIQEEKAYAIHMVTHEQLEEDGYLLNDSLIYQVTFHKYIRRN